MLLSTRPCGTCGIGYWSIISRITCGWWCSACAWESVEWEIGLIFRIFSYLITWPKCKHNFWVKNKSSGASKKKGRVKNIYISERDFMSQVGYIIRSTCRIAGAVPFGKAIYLYCLCPVEDLKMQFLRLPTHPQAVCSWSCCANFIIGFEENLLCPRLPLLPGNNRFWNLNNSLLSEPLTQVAFWKVYNVLLHYLRNIVCECWCNELLKIFTVT